MANHLGVEGVVKVGAVTIAEVTGWEFTEQAVIVPDTALGDTQETIKAGTKSQSGRVNCWWDETDTTGQGALVPGAEVTLNLYPEGAATGDKYWTGSVLIQSVDRGVGGNDNIITAVFAWQSNGAFTLSTAP